MSKGLCEMNHALVTGATSGIGLAIAKALLKDGCFVFLNYAHDDRQADHIRSLLAEHDERMEFIRADLSEYAGINNIEAALGKAGIKLTYLVLNFGATDRTVFGEININKWEHVTRANVSVPLFLIQSLFVSGTFSKNASVLCMGSLMASVPHAVSVSYGVSKAALSSLSSNLVKFLSPEGIRINTVEPGFVDTPWQKGKTEEQRARIEAKTALGRFAKSEEVADICVATLKNTYLTGSIIPISGGYGLI